MGEHDAVRMTDDERDEFLDGSGTGVIALSTAGDDPPHAVPVSYGYDPIEEVLYFRLAAGPDREKGNLADRAVTFVVYREDGDRWKSVTASGRLVSTTDDTVSREAIEGLERLSPIPIVDVFGEPTSEVEFEFYRLDPERFTSRVERPMEP
ncbi:pyridoxamine 5'-phosphate oxidase family protein [Halorubrum sp. JWXQ-INN 858]|uniref:pyridoxamine 5'-phosphate oxidase family protein n=1 Tax=Halorubrum sp. JWXQ-INN 858 TaxID=2690782 RepID=UPI00135964AD|nr:pyridoxamine 5'-phosphate oxidase family protein [Halorubrum sp. JWXQ-INN 858]MWV65824.1 pyridoxamine 5'-phosphate oxidase family protein [Halorubrum sp. JWXQ-INN 858]